MFDAGLLQLWDLRVLHSANFLDFVVLQGRTCSLDPAESTLGLICSGTELCFATVCPQIHVLETWPPVVVVVMSGAQWVVVRSLGGVDMIRVMP